MKRLDSLLFLPPLFMKKQHEQLLLSKYHRPGNTQSGNPLGSETAFS